MTSGVGDGGSCPTPSPLFCVAKRKKGDKGKKERISKHKLSKGCHQGQNIIVLAILERLEFENFSCRPTMVADNTLQCSMAHSTLKFILPVLSYRLSLKLGRHLATCFVFGQFSLLIFLFFLKSVRRQEAVTVCPNIL